jgi:hypothetical protein
VGVKDETMIHKRERKRKRERKGERNEREKT